MIQAADRLYDFGPGAGRFGGTITAQGTPREIHQSEFSLTGKYLSGREEIVIPTKRRMQSESAGPALATTQPPAKKGVSKRTPLASTGPGQASNGDQGKTLESPAKASVSTRITDQMPPRWWLAGIIGGSSA